MKKILVVFFISTCFVSFSQESKAMDIILGKIKCLGTGPNGDTYYRCKNRASICVEANDNEDGSLNVTLHFESGIVFQTVQNVVISPTYIDGEGNEITDITIVPLP